MGENSCQFLKYILRYDATKDGQFFMWPLGLFSLARSQISCVGYLAVFYTTSMAPMLWYWNVLVLLPWSHCVSIKTFIMFVARKIYNSPIILFNQMFLLLHIKDQEGFRLYIQLQVAYLREKSLQYNTLWILNMNTFTYKTFVA